MSYWPRRSHLVCAGCVVVMLLGGSREAAAQDRPSELSATEVQQALLHLNERIRGWYIVYDSVPQNDPSNPPGAFLRRTVAAYSPSSFYHGSAKAIDAYALEEDPFQECLTLSSDAAIVHHPRNQSFRRIKSASTDPLPDAWESEFIFLALGWWPLDSRQRPGASSGQAIVLPDVARSHDYVVRPFQEQVNGRWCHVLERPGRVTGYGSTLSDTAR